MKIKCPACQAVLNIPDSAAGKVVKCPCGKQLRAPGAASAPAQPSAQQPPRPTPQQPARPAPQQPRRPAPASGGGAFDAGMLDELTDQDLQPVSAVPRPGQAPSGPPPGSTGGKLLQQYAPTGEQGFSPSGGMQIASVGARIGGALVDGLFFVVGYAIGIGIAVAGIAMGGEEPTPITFVAFGLAVMVGLTPIVINIVLISMHGQTVGKKLCGTRMVIEATGQPAKFVQGFLVRQIVFGFLTGLPFVGFIIAIADIGYLFSENAKTLHDRLAGTVVVNA